MKNEQQVTVTHSSSEKTPALDLTFPILTLTRCFESFVWRRSSPFYMFVRSVYSGRATGLFQRLGVKLCQLPNADKEQAQRVVHSLERRMRSLASDAFKFHIEVILSYWSKKNKTYRKVSSTELKADILEQTITFGTACSQK
ncbi:hypothetical protein P4S64_07085 [Vibrio sp. M60_M31a]